MSSALALREDHGHFVENWGHFTPKCTSLSLSPLPLYGSVGQDVVTRSSEGAPRVRPSSCSAHGECHVGERGTLCPDVIRTDGLDVRHINGRRFY